MGWLDFEGRRVAVERGDTVASALHRAGVRTFSRSIKYHRRRGLYCLTGDCPNCILTVDGVPGVRACTTPARDGMRVRREGGWPSTERDVLAVADRLHVLLPVGFYSKTFIRPRLAWPLAERAIRRATGLGRLPTPGEVASARRRHAHADVVVVGAGVAGLAAALEAARRGERVVLCEEGEVGWGLPPGTLRERVLALSREARALGIELLEGRAAIGVYEGPLVPLAGPDELVLVHARRVVVATGAVGAHAVFPGNDLPGVFQGRGAARLAGVHGVPPGRRVVVWATTREGIEHLEVLLRSGVRVVGALVPEELAGEVPAGPRVLAGGRVVRAEGRGRLEAVVVEAPGRRVRIACDALALSVGASPRDDLLRMGEGLPVVAAGEAALPGCTPEEAEGSGRRAGAGERPATRAPEPPPSAGAGTVCLCEDVTVADLERAWREGWRSTEILKRYTTATMGPCRGALCARLLARFVAERGGAAGAPLPTARPPVRGVPLEVLAAGVRETLDRRTALHERHLEAGARLGRSGGWLRPFHYGDPVEEYRAVRERVGVMDVSTLGKFLVAGRDAASLLERVFPCRIEGLAPGRVRYTLALDEGGYVMDDGLVCALGEGRFYLTTTTSGSERMEAWLRDWIDRWGLHVHLLDLTAALGAINVAGPRARDLLSRLTADPIDADALPAGGHAEVAVAGVRCRAIRSGFVGELAFELHHPRSRSVELWDALLEAGRDLGIRPHGLDALEVLRLEKGHLYVGQDTLPDDHPGKLGLGRAVAMDKPWFVGKAALERFAARPLERRLVGLVFEGEVPGRGAPLEVEGRVVGRVTSSARSPALGRGIGLGWLRRVDGAFPEELTVGGVRARVAPTPFYDPEGARLRA